MKINPGLLLLFPLLAVVTRPLAAQWVPTNGPYTSDSVTKASCRVVAVVSGVIYAGGQGGLFLSRDGGANWTYSDVGGGNIISFASNGPDIYVGTDWDYPRRSSDNGMTWKTIWRGFSINPDPSRYVPYPVFAITANGRTLLASSISWPVNGFFRSSNSGDTWTLLNNAPEYVHCFLWRGDTVYAGSDYFGVTYSTDFGSTWTQSGLAHDRVLSLASDGASLFAGTSGHGVFRSTNYGINWTATNAGLTCTDVRALLFGGSTLFAATYGGGVFRSNDYGESWRPVSGGLPTDSLYALALYGPSLLAGVEKGGVWRANLGELVSVPDVQELTPKQFSLEQNYPNPFNPSTSVKYTVGGVRGQGSGVRVNLAVFDLLGRQVAVLVNEPKSPGSYEVNFDGSGLASGMYMYRLTAGSFVQSRKMLLVR